MIRQPRRGSALLIVLGMVSFMVVSAVAFSFYMRQNRIPSSYLRRATSMRQLAKAALAEAMQTIDDEVGDNRYPGVGGAQKKTGDAVERNRWYGRVLCPGGGLVDRGETLATLTLEGLAYLPPAMVNDVRYYARRTSTAKWRKLDFDAGRYAFCVVNVSDCIDLNRMDAEVPRGSSDRSRLSLTTLFEDDSLASFWSDPGKFQDFLDSACETMPFVSLADYNLALKSIGGADKVESPFANYFTGGGKGAGFYNFSSEPDHGSAEFLKYGAQRFVTESCTDSVTDEWIENSTVNKGLKTIDLSNPLYQPFGTYLSNDDEKKNDHSAGWASDVTTPFFSERLKEIGPYEAIALYDYLDRDDVPCSVAVPTVERAPMIVAVERDADTSLSVKLGKDDPGDPATPAQQTETVQTFKKDVTFYFEVDGKMLVNVGFTFPFKYRKELNDGRGNFTARAVGNFYLLPKTADGDKRCRTALNGVIGGWPTGTSKGAKYDKGVFTLISDARSVSLPTQVSEPGNAVSSASGQFKDVQLEFSGFGDANDKLKGDDCLVRYHLIRTKVKDDEGNWNWGGEHPSWEPDPGMKAEYGFWAVNNFASAKSDGHPAFDKDYVWGLSLAVKLYDNNNRLVDMVPAHIVDDEEKSSSGTDLHGYFNRIDRPVLRFDGDGMIVKLDADEKTGLNNLSTASGTANPVNLLPQTYLTDDPRYNFAAENWYPATVAAGGGLGEAWLGTVSAGTDDDHDRDIFMAVSNQGYLQDATEFAFIPRVKGFTNGGDFNSLAEPNGVIHYDGRDNLLHRGYMWRTYDCFGNGSDSTDALKISSGGSGFRVNPYSDDEFVSRMPFIDTPYDWWAAGTNRTDSVKQALLDQYGLAKNLETALKYTFGPRSNDSAAKIDADRIFDLADAIGGSLRQDKTWYETWRDIEWDCPKEDKIAGVENLGVKLHDVDRKFLYGYWRSCFANRQQLYIVFFRAESTMLGGGEGGVAGAASQLGARGVAVVWRDPKPVTSSDRNAPHRMRVLFYHQFE